MIDQSDKINNITNRQKVAIKTKLSLKYTEDHLDLRQISNGVFYV